MRIRLFRFAALALFITSYGLCLGQTPATGQATPAQDRVVGVVTAVDQTAGLIVVKSDTGEGVAINTSDTSSLLRLPAGETSAQKATKIALGDIAVGDRLFARGALAGDGKSIAARQVVVSGATLAAAPPSQDQQRDFRQRGLVGRVTAVNAEKKEVSVQTRSREATGAVTVLTSDATRVFRYAPDSLDIKNASRSSLSQLKIGDQLRALGNRSADGLQFTADEIIAGSMARTGGQVVAVNAAKNEITVKNAQGQDVTVAIGVRSSLRRVTPEAAAAFEANRPARPAGEAGQGRQGSQERRARGEDGPPRGEDGRPREGRERGAGGGEGRARGGRGFQDALEKLPAITINDLKKGDTVFVSGSEGADASHLTAIMLVTGDPAFMGRLLQTGPNRGPQNTGLPGDVMGGGVGSAERPPNP